MFKNVAYLEFGPRKFWQRNICRVGNTAIYATRLIGNWYWVQRIWVIK